MAKELALLKDADGDVITKIDINVSPRDGSAEKRAKAVIAAYKMGFRIWGAKIQNINLEYEGLEGASLARTDLAGSHINGACLREADLRWANLKRTYCRRADLSSPPKTPHSGPA